MKLYKVGDTITFGLNRPSKWNKKGKMDKYLGQTFTISNIYYFIEGDDKYDFRNGTFRIYNPLDKRTIDSGLWQFHLSDIKESNTINFPKFDFNIFKPEIQSKVKQLITEIFKTNNKMNTQQRKQAIYNTANALCNANNTFSNLELKDELRKQFPNEVWNQMDISVEMMDLADLGHFDYTHNGTYRTYFAVPSLQGVASNTSTVNQSMTAQLIAKAQTTTTTVASTKPLIAAKTTPTTKPLVAAKTTPTTKRIGRNKALEIIQNTNGKFFSVRFEKKNGEDRLMGVQYVKGTKPDPLGYVLLKDLRAKKTKSVNLQTLSEIKTNNILYKIK